MKKIFRGYYKLTDTEIQEIWDNGFISLDTNVLFNIYRYSDDTRKELIRVIKKYASQLWLTNHSAFEFHKNRISVISDQIVIYDETIKTFTKLENDIIKNLKTPHLSKIVLKQFEKTIKATTKDLEKKKTFYKKLLLNDTILATISTVFNNKIGDGFSSEEISKIEKEGEERYKKKMPPGYKDNDKSENKYGDLIIWKELIKKAKTNKKPFILIIDDVKEDWWLRTYGQTISPRQELSQELYKETQQLFQLYTPDRFLEFASKTEAVKQETIDEVREIRIEDYLSYYTNNDFPNQLYSTSPIGELIKTNDYLSNISEYKLTDDIAKYIKASDKLSDIYQSNDFLKRLEAYKNLGVISKNWTSNSLSDILKAKQLYSNLGNLKSVAEIQNSFKTVSENSLVDAYLKTKRKDNDNKDDNTEN
ncbi:MAG: PIN-like domain-containing protein [Bacteroidetes bacterium]|nr:PIN-like domain-containing protein [Bacteroidota bacterium]